MKRLVWSVFILILAIYIPAAAQTDVKIRRGEFKGKKAGFKQAWEHVLIGDAYYLKKGEYYNSAYSNYTQAIIYNSSNPELNYKMGIAAIYTDHKEEAAGFFLKAYETKKDVTEDILLYTGRALQYAGKYEGAVEKLLEYLRSGVKKSENNINLAKKFIEECNSAIELTKDSLRIEITNMGVNINSGSDDFSPVFTYDGKTMYFSSQRKLTKAGSSSAPDRRNENIYFSRFTGGKWSISELAGEDLMTDYNESPLYIDSAETKLYVYSGYENGGDIKVSSLRKGDWKAPENVPFNINSSGSETSLAFSPSGDEIYFTTTDGKDNLGEHDIYFITKLTDRKWSRPQNMGSAINTRYDEQAISISRSGDTLWFSSKGHNTMGGFDIFYSVRDKEGKWEPAVNAGYPLNTPWDEIFRSYPPSGGSYFYFASNRSRGFGGLDIYQAVIKPDSTVIMNHDSISVPPEILNSDTISTAADNDSASIYVSPVIKEESDLPLPVIPANRENFDDINHYFIKED